jgi:hypothetical protein
MACSFLCMELPLISHLLPKLGSKFLALSLVHIMQT